MLASTRVNATSGIARAIDSRVLAPLPKHGLIARTPARFGGRPRGRYASGMKPGCTCTTWRALAQSVNVDQSNTADGTNHVRTWSSRPACRTGSQLDSPWT